MDAICINQADETEKSEQIRNMYNIYRGASAVIATFGSAREQFECMACVCKWLQLAQPDTWGTSATSSTDGPNGPRRESEMLKLEADLGRHFNMTRDNLFALRDLADICTRMSYKSKTEPWQGTERELAIVSNPSQIRLNHAFWVSSLEVFDHEWFSRVWTFQECRLNRRFFFCLR